MRASTPLRSFPSGSGRASLTTPEPMADSLADIVRIDSRLLDRIGVREWGLPTLRIPGQIWRSEDRHTISCMLPGEGDRLNIDTRTLRVVEPGQDQWMPDAWRAALWEYVQAWPSSGMEYGPFLAITDAERCAFIRERAREIVEGDDIGCLLMAHGIGEFASVDYETPFVAA